MPVQINIQLNIDINILSNSKPSQKLSYFTLHPSPFSLIDEVGV